MFALYPKLNYLGKLLAKIETPASKAQDSDSLREAHQEFIGLLSHEIKTPLTSLRLSVQMVARTLESQKDLDQVDAKAAKIVSNATLLSLSQIADRQIDRLEQLLTGFLEASSLKDDPLLVEPQELDLGDLVTTEVVKFRADLNLKKGPIELKACDSIAGQWDRKLVQQALRNLLANAAGFGRGKPIEVSLQRAGRFARIEVRDQGIGIAASDQKRIFELFVRGVPSSHYGGVGVGLFLARQIAVAHHGDLKVRSRLGEGSTFVLKLPLPKKRSQSVKHSKHAA